MLLLAACESTTPAPVESRTDEPEQTTPVATTPAAPVEVRKSPNPVNGPTAGES
jgi:hypothetical protein